MMDRDAPLGHAEDREHRLAERVKELAALQKAAALITESSLTSQQLLARMVEILPGAFQYPDFVQAAIHHGADSAATPAFDERGSKLTAAFRTCDGVEGRVEVIHREPPPGADVNPFLTEEQHLLHAVASMLQSALDHRIGEARLERLARVTRTVTSELDLDVLLQAITRLLVDDFGYTMATVVLWDDEEGGLRRQAFASAIGPTPMPVIDSALNDRSPSMIAVHTRETKIYRWPDIEALGEPWASWLASQSLRAGCTIPLQTPRGCHGAMSVVAPDDTSFTPAAVRLLEQVAQPLVIAIENALAYRRLASLRDRLADENLYLESEVTRNHEFKDIVGKSRALATVLQQVRTVAPTDATVLLLGETGTGKELVARAVHESSRRQGHSFIRINSAALPAPLVESELFGYERGAFTGAVQAKVGRLELAHQGTLFLDEIGELPLEVQPKLLRALQEGEFERLGGTTVRRTDFRLIAATNRDLEEMVTAGLFRSDLYYRLSVFPIHIPPLRERPEDIPFLVRHFVDVFARELGRTITTIPARALTALQQWPWPGNIRELQNVIERAVILSSGPALELPAETLRPKSLRPVAGSPDRPARYAEGEKEIILRALREARGVVGGPSGAAARLGLHRTTLQSKMRKLGIIRPTF